MCAKLGQGPAWIDRHSPSKISGLPGPPAGDLLKVRRVEVVPGEPAAPDGPEPSACLGELAQEFLEQGDPPSVVIRLTDPARLVLGMAPVAGEFHRDSLESPVEGEGEPEVVVVPERKVPL